jgi:hypothetical protein
MIVFTRCRPGLAPQALARDFMVKTRRRKGMTDDVRCRRRRRLRTLLPLPRWPHPWLSRCQGCPSCCSSPAARGVPFR